MSVHTIMSADGTICAVIDGNNYTITREHPNYRSIKTCVKSVPLNETKLKELLNISRAVSHLTDGKVAIDFEDGIVYYDGVQFPDEKFCERVLRLMGEGHDIQYLVNFLNNLGQNPSFRSIMETFKFICNEGMPITPDGCFIGYKGVCDDYLDKHSRTISNTPDGRRIDYDRRAVCDNPNVGCGAGLHVGSYRYAKNWAGLNGRVVLVKVHPKDVVSVPNHECEKLRACGYWVIKDFTHSNSVLEGEVYDSSGTRISIHEFNQGQFDNMTAGHWDTEDEHIYGDFSNEDMDEFCDECDEELCHCVCQQE